MPFTTVILPPEIVEAPPLGSLCFHPSLLPRFRGGSAIPWQIILGERETGVTVFRPDAGVDTGPIVVQKGGVADLATPRPPAASTSTSSTRWASRPSSRPCRRSIRAAPRRGPQDESQATFQGLVDEAVARIDWSQRRGEPSTG